MCGFVGGYFKHRQSSDVINCAVGKLRHRGPDYFDFSEINTDNGYLYLGHTRLSIIDLSQASAQPFHSLCGRYSIVFNGEIYNYKELRVELEALGINFSTASDTEVLLQALITWGLDCLKNLIGMFSFSFYDKQQKSLTLARDAFGIKPLFYSFSDEELIFSSELPALLELKDGPVKHNLQKAYDYLVHGDYDSSEESFVKGVKHLPPAHYLTFDLATNMLGAKVQWWTPDSIQESNLRFDEAAKQLRSLFLDSVKLHLRSDVPLGVALSGGVDSSAVVAAVRYLEPELPLKTFSYIANDISISEEKWVNLLNHNMHTDPNKVMANKDEMLRDLDAMLSAQGEPFGSTSVYAQFRVFKLARERDVTVTLDGQGADELLAGYSGYPGHRLLSLLETKGMCAAHRFAKKWSLSPGRYYGLAWLYLGRIILPDWLYATIRRLMGRDFQPKWLDTTYLSENGVNFTENRMPLAKAYKGKRVKEALANSLKGRGLPSLLRHGDRNSMAFSIESRVPFLTLPIANFLLSLPENYLISDEGVTKHIFREAMRGIVPDSHLDRKDKIGFATSEASWLLEMVNTVRLWVHEAKELPFLNKDALLAELDQIADEKKRFDGRVWRWINFIRWSTLIGVE